MCLNKKRTTNHTVSTRLTLWYALFSAIFCMSIFTVVSVKMRHNAQKRVDNSIKTELGEFKRIYEQEGLGELQEEFRTETEAQGANELFCRLITPQNIPLATSNTNGWMQLPEILQNIPLPKDDRPQFNTIYPAESHFNTRMGSAKTADGNIIQFGFNLHSENKSHAKIQRILTIGSLLLLILNAISGWVISRRAMSGVRRVTKAVSNIEKDSLDCQVSFGNEGLEINELVNAFNLMLSRIQSLISEIKEVSDNVAHDLRSPITRMRGSAETTLTGPQEIEAYREMGQTILEECDSLTEMINTTLEIAQTESGLVQISYTPLDLREILTTAIELFEPVAEEKQIRFLSDLPDDPLIIPGDKTRIQRICANLIDNAIKYTPVGGKVSLRAFNEDGHIHIEISDTGPGIDPTEKERIFDRFYRGEKSRSSSGNGLGLCLARTLIHAHGGTITVQSEPKKGSTFIVIFP